MDSAKSKYSLAVDQIGMIARSVLILLFCVVGTTNAYTIVGFGDSITKGTPYVEEREGDGRRVGGYEPELEALLEQEGNPSFVYNWGIGGENTQQGVYRIDDVLVGYDHVDFVLIMEGTNDFGLVSMNSTMFNLLRMIDRSRRLNVVPILATLTPDTLNVERKRDLIQREYNPRIREMASTSQVILADQYNAIIDNWASLNYDGVHPNRSGYRVLARTWKNAILSGATNLRPEVRTLDASPVSNTSVILNGTVNPNQNSTTYHFEYDKTTDYHLTTNSFDAGSGNTSLSVSVTLNNLDKNTLYHYRIVASNSQGSSFGADRTFSTGSSRVNTLEASNVDTDSARLNGSLDPEGTPTNYYFEYGTSSSYGEATQEKNVGNETEPVNVSEEIVGLVNGTTYHYRLVSEQNGTTLTGNDMTFTTGSTQNGGSGGGCFIQSILP